MEAILTRALLLYDHGRFDLAEAEARRHLGDQPDDGDAHALLALCLLKRKDWGQALREVTEAVRLNPTKAYTHYVAGHVLLAADRHDAALRSARAAIEFDPSAAAHHGLLASIHLDLRHWSEALKAAEDGLALDPEHVGCNNVRGMALVKLGRRSEAGATMRETLARDPEDAFTHANRGWALLHERKPKEAMEHFREALRLDPTMDWARAGIVEALKARHFVYRWMLAYFLFMSRLSSRAQWIIVVCGWFGAQFLSGAGKSHPQLKPFVTPVVVAYMVFAILTWLAYPLFNLLLRLSRYGRLALSAEQVTAANWVGGALAITLVSAICVPITGWDLLIDVALISGLMTLPIAALFTVERGWPRAAMIVASVGLVCLGLVHIWRIAEVGGLRSSISMKDWNQRELVTTFGRCILGVTILSNILAGTRVKKG